MSDEIRHYGTPRRSGRYPWGSGQDPYQNSSGFLGYVDKLHKEGLSDVDIAKSLDITTTQLRAKRALAKNEIRQADYAQVLRLKEKGMSNSAIGRQMGMNESMVRSMLDPSMKAKSDILNATADKLRDEVAKKKYLDIGPGEESYLGVSRTKLNTAIALLKEEGYTTHDVMIEQVTNRGKFTRLKVLAAPDTSYSEVLRNQGEIKTLSGISKDGGRTYLNILPPTNVSSSRLMVNYAQTGGSAKDGVIELRRGVDDLSLGSAKYAQVRIAIDGTHYLKGMAVYADDLPAGVDIQFNSNKTSTGNKLDALKPMKTSDGRIDPDNPFGASISAQRTYIDKNGKEQLSALNIVREEGDWLKWSNSLASQVLSKQSPKVAEKQLGIVSTAKKAEYEDIMGLTNPVVKKKLLISFADSCDSKAVNLKAAALPRQGTHVILPIKSLKETEVYAPNYRNGENVVLIRYPHGGTFEIPELKVNNKNTEAKSVIGGAKDAIGINSKVAGRLSGADFDGDFVLVIPNAKTKDGSVPIRTSPALEKLKDFDPTVAYPGYPGMKVMSNTQKQMGEISNLITDMTVKGANSSEIARAVRHSMVVIDAEKKELNYKQSYLDNGIAALKNKYQARVTSEGKVSTGASTLISRASAEQRVPKSKARSAKEGGGIDPTTGKKVMVPTGDTYLRRTVSKSGNVTVKETPVLKKSTQMAETDDAFSLSSGTRIESVYATHANTLKSLANEARKSSLSVTPTPYSPSANKAYASEVATLNSKLRLATENSVKERQAQVLASTTVRAKIASNPELKKDKAAIKKLSNQALASARSSTGGSKSRIVITDKEWSAIQAGAITTHKLSEIVNHADLDRLKELSMPKTKVLMTPTKIQLAQLRLNAGHTAAEVADSLGVSVSTLHASLNG